MESRLIVFLPEKPEEPISWLAIDEGGYEEGQGRLDEGVPDWALGRSAVGVADGRAVVITRIAIPARSRERIRRALPFALEDQLSEDVGELHFAPGQRDKSDRISVAVVAHACMSDWLERLHEAGIELDELYPEPMMLPLVANSWTLVWDRSGFVLRTGTEQGFAGEHQNLPDLLSIALAQTADAPPESLMVYYEPGMETPELPSDSPPASWQPVLDRRALVAEQSANLSGLSLLVGPYQPRRTPWLPGMKQWALVAGLALVALLVTTGRAWIENYQLNQKVAEQEQQLRASFKNAFPNRDIATGQMRRVMANRLDRLRTQGGSGEDQFLRQLQAIAPSLGNASDVETTALDYRGGQLELEVTAESLQTIDQLKQSLARKAGGEVAVRSTSRNGDRIRARITIQAGRT